MIRRTGHLFGLFAAGAILATFVPAIGSAQQTPGGWSGQATLYGWLPTITGAQERRNGDPAVDLDNADVLSALDFAFMGAAEIRNGKWGLLVDLVYADLSQDGTWVDQRLRTEVGTKLTLFTLAAAYRVYEAERRFVDLYAGGRYYNTDLSFDIKSDRFDRTRNADLSWGDPIVGIRAATPLIDRFSVSGFADIGGFEANSDLSWEVYGGVNYDLTEKFAATLGYRYMSIEYEANRATLDIDIQGPVLGLTYRF